ncbi:acetoin utilization protein AcuC [Thiolapillus sp.]|nr:acetoin utilization protein AcuC [Thiolapillus sp.]
MTQTCVYLGPELARYGFGDEHPFGTDRMGAFQEEFERRGLDKHCQVLPPMKGDPELLALFHAPDYLQLLAERSKSGEGYLDGGDTPAFRGVFEASLTVAGTVCDAADRLIAGECARAFVPIAGLHHARRDGAAGFCAVNDCGIVIEYLKKQHHLTRIAYVDIDAHHGDGVFYAFEEDAAVIFVDFHEDGRYLYPGTGAATETGRGAAKGRKLNIPLPPEADDVLFTRLWPAAEHFLKSFDIEFCILQAGADSIGGDPITHLNLSPRTHAAVARALSSLPCQRLLVLRGGGYNRHNLAQAWNDVVQALSA